MYDEVYEYIYVIADLKVINRMIDDDDLEYIEIYLMKNFLELVKKIAKDIVKDFCCYYYCYKYFLNICLLFPVEWMDGNVFIY